MAEPRMVRGPGGELYAVPADATDAQISSYFQAIPAANAQAAPKAKTWSFSRAPDPEGAFALSEQAQENPKAAVAGAAAGMLLPTVPTGVGLATRAAAAAADVVSPELVGIVSPRLAHALRVAQKLVEASKQAAPAAAETSSKMRVNATDVLRIKSLVEQGIPQSEAVRTVMNLRVLGKLP